MEGNKIKTRFAIRTKKLLTLITASCIIGLSFIASFPWLSVTEGTSSGEAKVTYSWSMMEQGNAQVQEIGDAIELLAMMMWITIIFCVAAFVGSAVLASERYAGLGQFIMMVGCATLIFSIIVIALEWKIFAQIESAPSLSLSVIITQLPIKYIHLTVIMGGLSLLGSVFYTITFFNYWLHRVTGSLKQLQKTTTPQEKPKREKRLFKRKKEKAATSTPTVPYSGIPVERVTIKTHEDSTKEMPAVKKRPEGASEGQDKEEYPVPIEKPMSPKKEPVPSPFDKKTTEKPVKRTVSVRCPQCSQIFTVERDEGATKIQCPHCGKTGVVK